MQRFCLLHRLPVWARALTLGAPLAVALVACGGDDGPAEALSKYTSQTLKWRDCAESPSPLAATARLQCTQFLAPLDYAAPEKGEPIVIKAMRVPAMSEQRKGAIFFNPGGPGGDGLSRGFDLLVKILQQAGATDDVKILQTQLLRGYDLLGFNPRGTDETPPLECKSSTFELATDLTSAGRNAPGNQDAVHANLRATADACQANPIARYLSTDATARDMDLLRGLMGDSQISYIGISYGTWLGAWYARLFPQRVNRMVLDSNADVSADHLDFNEYQAIARDTLLTDALAPYAARHATVFGLGNTPDEVRATLAAFDPALKTAVAMQSQRNVYSNQASGDLFFTLVAAKGLSEMIQQMLPLSEDSIRAHAYGVADTPARQAAIRSAALQLKQYRDLVNTRAGMIGTPLSNRIYYGPDGQGSNNAAFQTVMCNDNPKSVRSLAQWQVLGDHIAQQAPFFGGINMAANQACLYWELAPIPQPPLSALQGLDSVLMLQTQYDAATPSPGALKGFAQLPKARLVYVPGEFQHGVFPDNTSCVDATVLRHLLGQAPAERETVCPMSNVAFPLDQTVATKSLSVEEQERIDLINAFKRTLGPVSAP